MAQSANQTLAELLGGTARSFQLTLRVLPAGIRFQIGVAYLLARTTDTIADSGRVEVEPRLRALKELRGRIEATSDGPLDLGELARRQGDDAERKLLERCEGSLALLRSLAPDDLRLVQQVLGTITSGQESDLRCFGGASAEHISALRNDSELDDYTYRVAGCVGEFWTSLCLAHMFQKSESDAKELRERGVKFGKGLQLINILRDLASDLRMGRCYLPEERLAKAGLRPADLLDPANEGKLRPLYDEYLALAEGNLLAGWEYTNSLPWSCPRVRFACAWPILIGMETIKLLRAGRILDAGARIKISRSKVKFLIARSVLYYPIPALWRSQVIGTR
jgi:farnesyl-diphosphate farnesyltransferase